MTALDSFLLHNKNVLITGGASGIGKAIAVLLANAGANLAIADLNLKAANDVVNDIKKMGKEAFPVKVDVSNNSDIEEMITTVKENFKGIDVLVNSAGISIRGPAEDVTLEDWNKVLNVNLRGAFFCCQKVGREMIKQKSGSIINIASMAGFISTKGRKISAYSASKGGLVMLTKNLATEWAEHNIRVNAVAPGNIETPLTEAWVADPIASSIALELTPIKRIAPPTEVAPSVLFLASDASSYITGHTLIVDGGYTAW